MRRFYFLCILILFTSSCAFHGGFMTSNVFQNEQMEIVRSGSGSAKTVHVFGIGGLAKLSLAQEAKKNLYANLPLRRGESYANMATNTRIFPFLFVFVTEISFTADVVKQTGSTAEEEYQEAFQPPPNEKGFIFLHPDGLWLKAGDQVWVRRNGRAELGTVQVVINDRKIFASSPSFGTGKYRLNEFFLADKNKRFRKTEYKIGDSIEAEYDGNTVSGTIVGINHAFALIKSGGAYFQKSFFDLDKDRIQFYESLQIQEPSDMAIIVEGKLKSLKSITRVGGKNFNVEDSDGKLHFGMSKKLLYHTKEGYTTTKAKYAVNDLLSFKHDGKVKKGRVVGISELNIAVQSDTEIIQISREDIVEILNQ